MEGECFLAHGKCEVLLKVLGQFSSLSSLLLFAGPMCMPLNVREKFQGLQH